MRRGAALNIEQAWDLALGWYRDRLDPDFAGRSAGDIRAIFSRLGLTGPFWAVV